MMVNFIRRSSCVIDRHNVKHLERNKKELMPVAWNPTRWWDWCMSEDVKKEIEPIFTDKKLI